MKFWVAAAQEDYQTAEYHECAGTVLYTLAQHLKARASYSKDLQEWEESYEEADGPAEKRSLLKQKPKEPTPANLKTLIGQHLHEKFPFMRERRHFYLNLLKVLLVLKIINPCRLTFAFLHTRRRAGRQP